MRTALIASFALTCTTTAQQPAQTADAPHGVLRFDIRDDTGARLPCRLSLRTSDNPRPALFPNTDVDPDHLAVRRNTIYTLDGAGAVTVPVGDYTLWITRGLEYSIARRDISIREGQTENVAARLVREIDSAGWVSGDFHLHTLTHSGHGDSNMPERIISIVGEGVEFAVATDHNHHTDYGPTMQQVGAEDRLTAVVGNEISTAIGHFNAFPLAPGRVIPYRQQSAIPLFSIIREWPNEFETVPVIQLNHPRWAEINYFDQAGLDPLTGTSTSEVWSDDFDTIEILNENAGWGYFDPGTADVATGNQTFSVLNDWFNLLNQGHRSAAVGNSDSHTVESNIAGYPRNFVMSATDDPAEIDPAQISEALKANQVFTTLGPFVTFEVNGVTMGGTCTLTSMSEEAVISINVQAASWIDCDRVKIVVNGDVAHTIDVPDTRDVSRLDTTWSFVPASDCWVSLLVEGDDPLTDIVHDKGRPIFPIAITNPVWIDANDDDEWTPPAETARRRVAGAADASSFDDEPPMSRSLIVQAAADGRSPIAPDLIRRMLDDDDRAVRLAAAHAAGVLADPALIADLHDALDVVGDDTHLHVELLGALTACGDPAATDRALALLLDADDRDLMMRFGDRLQAFLPGTGFVSEWMVVGFFDAGQDAFDADLGPETDTNAVRIYTGKTGPTSWQAIDADAQGYVDLTSIPASAGVRDNAIAYIQCTIISPDERDVTYTFGADDGSRLWINDELVYEENGSHGANPLQTIGKVTLRTGANRVLIKIRNGNGDFGAYFRILDDDVSYRRK